MKLKRVLAFCLVLTLLVSVLPMGTAAEEPQSTTETTSAVTETTESATDPTTEQETQPGNGEGLLDSLVNLLTGGGDKDPTDPTESTASTETTEATEATESTESTEATDPTESIESTEATEPTEDEEEKDLPLEHLANCDTLEAMVQAVTNQVFTLTDFTAEDVVAVESKISELVRSIENPTDEMIDSYYFMLNRMLEVRETLGMCTCGSSTKDHGAYCPLYVSPGTGEQLSRKVRSSRIASSQNTTTESAGVITDKWVEEIEGEEALFKLFIEAYATGTTTTTQYIKPADMVIVVDQSASMMYADMPNLDGGIPVSGSKGYTRTDLENNTQAQKNASHGLYYMAIGDQTMCFLIYKNNTWYYFDTYLSKSGSDHLSWPTSWGTKPNGYWDSCMEAACKSWTHINNNLLLMDDTLWTRFEKNGIYPTRYGSIYWALDDFLDEVAASGADHRIAIAGFAGRTEVETEIICNLQQVNTTAGFNAVQAAIDDILCTGVSTHHDAGIAKANEIFEGETKDLDNRDRHLIFFSDGEGSSGTNDNMTLAQSYISKNTHGATVYSIGTAYAPKNLMEWLSSNYPSARATNNLGSREYDKYFFHAENASDLGNIFGQLSSTVGSTTVTLTESSYIKDVVTQYFTIPEGADSVTAYTVKCTGYSNNEPTWDSDRELVDRNDITIDGTTVYVTGFDYAGNFVSEGGRVEGTTDQAGDFHGRKMVIEIIIEAREEFLGGNHVITNESTSGLYDGDGNPVEMFPVPDVDVETNTVASIESDINIYLGGVFTEEIGTDGKEHIGLSISDLNAVLKGGYNDVALDFTQPSYGLDEAMDDYVTVKLEIFQPVPDSWTIDMRNNEDYIDDPTTYLKEKVEWEEHPVLTMDQILWDTPYRLRLTITPKNLGGECQEAVAEAYDWIHVFYPEITFHDVHDFYYGEAPTSDQIKAAEEGEDQSGITIDWINESREGTIIYDKAVTMTMPADGKIPAVTMSYSYGQEGDTLTKEDGPVQVLVESVGYVGIKDGTMVNQYVHFKWKSCNPDCGQKIEDHVGNARNVPEFYIHPKTCSLTVTKTGGDAGEPYVFDIYKDGEKYTEATITGNGSMEIKELPIGTYSIAENAQWSWRYSPTYDKTSVSLNRNKDEDSITCTNKREEDQWLNGYADVVTNVFGVEKTS